MIVTLFFDLCGILLKTKKIFTHDTDKKLGVKIIESYKELERA